MKVVHEEDYKDLLIKVKAKYFEDCGIKVNGVWYRGRVTLYCEIYDSDKLVNKFNSDENSCFHSDFLITFVRKYKRYGFLKLKKEEYVEHILEVYDRELLSFIKQGRDAVNDYIRSAYREKREVEITNGLPDSLKNM